MTTVKWIFSRSRLSRIDVAVLIVLLGAVHAGQIKWWLAGIVTVIWLFISTIIEKILFGDNYVK